MPPCFPPASPPYTSVPDYVWADVRDASLQFAKMPRRPREEPVRQIPHPSAETALQAAKRACRAHPGRWFGRCSDSSGGPVFLVYDVGKVIERHVVGP